MVGNFNGVLIFVVDLQSQKFPPMKINAYSIYKGRGQKHCGSAANFFSTSEQLNNRYCHPADGVRNIVLSHAVCPSFFTDVAW
jgi:hypothetical protein